MVERANAGSVIEALITLQADLQAPVSCKPMHAMRILILSKRQHQPCAASAHYAIVNGQDLFTLTSSLFEFTWVREEQMCLRSQHEWAYSASLLL